MQPRLSQYIYRQQRFVNQWEYWVALSSANQVFFNQSQPNNGLNNDWRHYSDIISDWRLEYRTEVAMKVNGVPAIYKNGIQYADHDRNLAGAETSCSYIRKYGFIIHYS
ncbi:UNKNOWN [Stylonychia lemnae]|uniref:Uncharacterized protein n=1 Tax=Stylonychia lemnae TaxID=5949 RepID=A0A078AHY2_STYLE|nr:UNKNOWN [Stylonychia lemnae]|eukprot:CDW81526.1 UNKNOWN [Stylonychia lemnae]